jgi:hypothetical protein
MQIETEINNALCGACMTRKNGMRYFYKGRVRVRLCGECNEKYNALMVDADNIILIAFCDGEL